MLVRAIFAFAVCSAASAADRYLFTSFRGNGETGVFFAMSADGKTWTPLNNNKPWIKPQLPGMLMRDPWLGQGPDGVWRMLWTLGWNKAPATRR